MASFDPCFAHRLRVCIYQELPFERQIWGGGKRLLSATSSYSGLGNWLFLAAEIVSSNKSFIGTKV